MKTETLEKLNSFFEQEPLLKGEAVSEAEIGRAESALQVHFSDEYREFVTRFGGAILGPYPIYGLRRAEPMDDRLWSVVEVTNHFRTKAWPGSGSWYVISMDHSGNPIGVDSLGQLHSFDHDTGQMIEVAPDFETYLLACIGA